MNPKIRPSSLRIGAILLCALSGAALIPGICLAYVGLGWVGIGWPAEASAAALVAAPAPLAGAAVLAWTAARGKGASSAVAGALCLLAAMGLYVVAGAWGGRMLL